MASGAEHPDVAATLDNLATLYHAQGRYGSTLDYLRETALELRRRGIRDREVERLMRLLGD